MSKRSFGKQRRSYTQPRNRTRGTYAVSGLNAIIFVVSVEVYEGAAWLAGEHFAEGV